MQNTFSQSGNDSKWFLKKIIFQNRYVALETPSRPPPSPFMANAILNFHFDYWHPSLRLSQPQKNWQSRKYFSKRGQLIFGLKKLLKKSWHPYFSSSYIDYKLCGQSCLGLGWNRHKVPSLTKFIYQFHHSAHKDAIQSGIYWKLVTSVYKQYMF